MGNFDTSENFFDFWKNTFQGAMVTSPTSSQVNSLINLVNYLNDKYGISYIGGHRDFTVNGNKTKCPGDALYLIMSINGLVKLPK